MQFVLKVDAQNERRAYEVDYVLDARSQQLCAVLPGSDVIFYQPRRSVWTRSGRHAGAYVGWGRIASVDGASALIEGFDPFYRPVPLRHGSFHFEPDLWLSDGNPAAGAFQKQIRPVEPASFDRILEAGADPYGAPETAWRVGPGPGLAEPQVGYGSPVRYRLKEERVRSEAFARAVDRAYGRRCVVSGLEIGTSDRFEAERIHFRSLKDGGPNSVRNGAPMAQTIHWMFDQGMFAIGRDYRIAMGTGISPATRQRLFPNSHIRLPSDPADRPHDEFLAWHRQTVFRGS